MRSSATESEAIDPIGDWPEDDFGKIWDFRLG